LKWYRQRLGMFILDDGQAFDNCQQKKYFLKRFRIFFTVMCFNLNKQVIADSLLFKNPEYPDPKNQFMKNNFLHEQCVQLYEEMLHQTAGCECKPSGDAKWIEWGRGNVIQSWFRVERMADGYQFVSDYEEICFLNIVQSQFGGWINFLHYYTNPLVAAG
jgi:hypothetical protein